MFENPYKDSAEYYSNVARRSVMAGNPHGASLAYWMSVKSWEKAVELHPSLTNHLLEVRREYDRFMHDDRAYAAILRWIRRTVGRRESILQSSLLSTSHDYSAEEIKDVLRFAVQRGEVRRARTGDDYLLYTSGHRRGLAGLLRSMVTPSPP